MIDVDEKVIRSRRNHWTEFTNHMIKFFISSPDSINVQEHTKADVKNWMAVQTVWCELETEQQRLLTDIYRRKNIPFAESVKICSSTHQVSEGDAWKLISLVCVRIAKVRGLI